MCSVKICEVSIYERVGSSKEVSLFSMNSINRVKSFTPTPPWALLPQLFIEIGC